ncbi:hypothetical protein [Alienimonas sp. DA493]|uniref:hypothetical protein n=1 Tax=Alienimonas sp. DA493 TaxID=3373605 RepID=UPI003754CC3B
MSAPPPESERVRTEPVWRAAIEDAPAVAGDDAVGGPAWLPPGFAHPRCGRCDAAMQPFVQLTVREEYGLPFAAGSRLALFMCPTHNDPAEPEILETGRYPESYRTEQGDHFAALLFPPGDFRPSDAGPDRLRPLRLTFARGEQSVAVVKNAAGEVVHESGEETFRLGGTPCWINYRVTAECACGGRLAPLLALPENQGFPKRPETATQPDSFSSDEDCYLLGNVVTVLACDRQCDPRSTLTLCDN